MDVTNSHPVTFSAAWELMLLVGHSSLHRAFASVSQGKPLLAELPVELEAVLALFTFSSLNEGTCQWRWFVCISIVCSQPGQPGLSKTAPFSTVPTQGVSALFVGL